LSERSLAAGERSSGARQMIVAAPVSGIDSAVRLPGMMLPVRNDTGRAVVSTAVRADAFPDIGLVDRPRCEGKLQAVPSRCATISDRCNVSGGVAKDQQRELVLRLGGEVDVLDDDRVGEVVRQDRVRIRIAMFVDDGAKIDATQESLESATMACEIGVVGADDGGTDLASRVVASLVRIAPDDERAAGADTHIEALEITAISPSYQPKTMKAPGMGAVGETVGCQW